MRGSGWLREKIRGTCHCQVYKSTRYKFSWGARVPGIAAATDKRYSFSKMRRLHWGNRVSGQELTKQYWAHTSLDKAGGFAV
jgi:hypothetical protein